MHALLLLALLPAVDVAKPKATADAGFERHVRPVLVEHCIRFHGPEKQMGGLRLDSPAALLAGGDTGPAVEPGDDGSLLLRAVRHAGDLKMPKDKKLPPPAVAALTTWVKAGAPWPDERPAPGTDDWKKHWAFRPVRRPAVPVVEDPAARNPIDRFLLAKLREKGLNYSMPAGEDAVRRRLSFALTGLPPEGDAGETHERRVERLLASPSFGEHLARPLARRGPLRRHEGLPLLRGGRLPLGWTYRDWLIEAINAGLPYDRFVEQQLAADLLPRRGRPLAARPSAS